MATVTKLAGRAKPWRVDWRESGQRRTRHFRTQGEAEAFRRELGLNQLAPDLAVSVDERMAVVKLRSIAQSTGLSLAELVAKIETDARPVSDSRIENAVAAYLADCRARNLRPRTLLNYEWELDLFRAGRNDRLVGSVTRAELVAYITLNRSSSASRSSTRTILQGWLRWCARKGWCDLGRWSDAVTWQSRREDKTGIGILRPAVLRVLLCRLPDELRFPLAVCCLTGIRPSGELTRLRWEHIDARRKVIELPGDVTKTRQPRTLSDLPHVVWRWVARYRGRGPVLPVRYDQFRAQVASAMDGLGEWPHDATRHSFASYGFHVLGPERTVELMGHVGGYGLFARHYKAAARPVMARLWFGIGPR